MSGQHPEFDNSVRLSQHLYNDYPGLDELNLEPGPDNTVLLHCHPRSKNRDTVTFCYNGPAEFCPELNIATHFINREFPDCRTCTHRHSKLEHIPLPPRGNFSPSGIEHIRFPWHPK